MTSKIFFIGCTHFGHFNINKFANRPFTSVEQADATLIKNWNSVVTPNDTVWHLGDFSYKTANKDDYYLSKLNGNIKRIRGNHDRGIGSPYEELFVGSLKIVLFHYPIEEWNAYYHGAIHLHAHTHSSQYYSAKNRYNVGADAINLTPISLDEVLDRHNKERN